MTKWDNNDTIWGNTLCANCGQRLSAWADILHGCCALCRHPFPEEFQWLHKAAIKEREEAPERAILAAKKDKERRYRRFLEPWLHQYLAKSPNATEQVSRLELIAMLKTRTGESWVDCRDAVDQFITENNVSLTPR